ncbi:hypothetical protein JKF63_01090 [Porcisia hertigi]|uniref:PSP1 C-terminal domain-containing protein n=1 Tax=Porcisia hertigi TaxID=2761500 RepID=A0A836HU20_9TRYP|nr:hypothetical protein JKF63_01090 [Porcisia hertigi]
MAYTSKSASKAVDDFFDNEGEMSPAVKTTDHSLNTVMDHSHFATMIDLQKRLLSIMAEAQTIVQHLQQNGFFPRSNGANPDKDAANVVIEMLRSSLEAPKSVPPPPNGMGCVPVPPTTAKSARCMPTPSLAEMPAAMEDAPPQAPAEWSLRKMSHRTNKTDTNASSSENAHNGVNEIFASGQSGQVHPCTDAAGDRRAENESDELQEGSEVLAFVEFKRGRVRKYVCDHRIEPGNYVLVDGDRGTDCGLLVQTIARLPNNETAVVTMEGCDIPDEKIKLENGRVLRKASEEDIDRLHNIIANAEGVALKTCRQRCEDLGIDIDLQDVEYQFDMKKISFFFDCDHSVDFRSLVRELYRTFGARIWMENTNPRVKNSMPESNGHERGHGGGGGGGGHHGNGGGWRNHNRGSRGRDY